MPLHRLNKHKTFIQKKRAPLFCDQARTARTELRSHERWWTTSQLEVNRQIYHAKRTQYNRLLDDLRISYHLDRIAKADDQKKLFAIVDQLVGLKAQVARETPVTTNQHTMADDFAGYFFSKVDQLRE